MKYLFKTVFYLCVAWVLVGCQNDDYRHHNNQARTEEPSLIIKMEKVHHLEKSNAVVFSKLQSVGNINKTDTAKNNSSDTNFSLILDDVQIIEKNTYTQYTVLVAHANSEQILKNYVLLVFDTGEERQFLVNYPKIVVDNGITLDYSQATMEPLEGEILINKSGVGGARPCLDGVQELVDTYQVYQCTQYVCSDRGHAIGDNCLCGISVDCTPAYEECGWETVNVWGCSGGSASSGNGNGTTGGNSNNNGDDDNDDDELIETLPMLDLNPFRECFKVTNFLAQNPNYKNALLIQNNYLHDYRERSFSKFQENDTITQSVAPNSFAEVRMIFLPGKTYEAFSHVHYETPNTAAQDTFSIFSLGDLEGIARIFKANLATDKFVTFLASGKQPPAFYAMTINDKDKFLKVFEYAIGPKTPPQDPVALIAFLDAQKKYKDMKRKYYEGKDAVIKKDNTDNTAVLRAFLEMMQESDMGVSLFITESSYSTFTDLKYDPTAQNSIKETPCN